MIHERRVSCSLGWESFTVMASALVSSHQAPSTPHCRAGCRAGCSAAHRAPPAGPHPSPLRPATRTPAQCWSVRPRHALPRRLGTEHRPMSTQASQAMLVVKNLPASARDARGVGSIPGSGRSLEGVMAIPSSILAWRTPLTEEPGGLQSIGSQKHRTWEDS